MIDSHFGRYRLLRQVGLGGMAEIFLARQEGPEGFKKTVVVKRVLPQHSQDEAFLRMFLDEARLAACLSHPNIVQVYDFGQADGRFYIAMEYLDGYDLRRVMREAAKQGIACPVDVAAVVGVQVCDGLQYAHTLIDEERGPLHIVHRDVTPSNLMVTRHGVVKVLDFGIARAAGRSSQTTSGIVKGKPSYMSPEQASGDEIDGRTDVFALGLVLYEMLTGVRLFQRDNDIATMKAIFEAPIPPPSAHRPSLSAEVDQVLLKAVARDLAGRFASAQDFQRGLAPLAGSRPGSEVVREWVREVMAPSERVHTATASPVPSRDESQSWSTGGPWETRPSADPITLTTQPGRPAAGEPASISEASSSLLSALGGSDEPTVHALENARTQSGSPASISAPPLAAPAPAAQTPTRRRPAATAIVGAALALSVSGVAAWWLGGRTPVEPEATGALARVVDAGGVPAVAMADSSVRPASDAAPGGDAAPSGILGVPQHVPDAGALVLAPPLTQPVTRPVTRSDAGTNAPAADPPRKTRRTEAGWLNVTCVFHCEVSIDGGPWRAAPIVKLALPAGPHRVSIRNITLGWRDQKSVTIEADREAWAKFAR